MNLAHLGLGYLSGVLSTLSPCVLPLIPIVLASAVNAHRWGGVALGLGLTLSFTATGLFLATLGLALGLDGAVLRSFSALLMLAFGVLLLVPPLYDRFALAASLLVGRGSALSAGMAGDGLGGQFAIGLVLGLVWTPCVGPTLGAAATLASSGENLVQAGIVMLAFGLGAATPLVILGMVSRESLQALRGRLMQASQGGKKVLGVLLLLIGLNILTGLDRRLEHALVALSPDWLTELTTRY